MAMNFDYIRNYYNLPFLRRGQEVIYEDRYGKIVGTHNASLRIRFSGAKGDYIGTFHPTWNLTYLDKSGNVLKEFGK